MIKLFTLRVPLHKRFDVLIVPIVIDIDYVLILFSLLFLDIYEHHHQTTDEQGHYLRENKLDEKGVDLFMNDEGVFLRAYQTQIAFPFV